METCRYFTVEQPFGFNQIVHLIVHEVVDVFRVFTDVDVEIDAPF